MSLSIGQAASRLRSGEITSRGLTDETLAGIDALDGELASFVLVDRAGALAAAEQADIDLASGGPLGRLSGIPVAVKDIINMRGHPTRCGSPAYANRPADHDATVVSRLRAAGAIIIGKTTVHELACGVYTPPTSNPWDPDRVPGGSSGGSGAAVAAGLVPMAIGSDTGGSIRIPAAVCGVVGLKPTYGRVSRAGVEPLAWSLDHIGPLTTTVEDAAITLDIMAGADPADPSAAHVPVPDYESLLGAGVEGLRLGILVGSPVEPMQAAVAEAFSLAVDRFAEEGATVVRIEIPELVHTLAAEFGIVAPEAGTYHRNLVKSKPELIDPGIRSLMVAGLLLPAVHYLKAQQARTVIAGAIRRAFEANRLAALLTPTLPATAALKDQDVFDYNGVHESVTFSYVRTTAPFNLSGLPALSIPCGLDATGLPIGLQIAGRPFDESTILRIGAAYEASTAWVASQAANSLRSKGSVMSNMRVLVYDGPHLFHIEERPLPVPGPGEMRLRIAYVGICGSDLHGYTGESGRRVPGMVMGHEASGWVEAVGPGVTTSAIGQAVTFNPAVACDGSCGHDVDNHCTRLRVIGVTPDYQGAFADAMVAPADRVVALGGLSMEWGAAAEPMAVAVQAVRRAGVRPRDSILIIGGGMIGQCIAQAARLKGAGLITVSEGIDFRRRLAREAGFDTVTPEEAVDLPPMNRAFDAVGVTATASLAIRSLVKGGTACFVGLGRPEVSIPLFDVVVPERTVVGTFAYTDAVFRQTVKHLAARRLDLSPLLGNVEGFNDIASAFEDLANGHREEVKIMLATGALPPEPVL